MVPWWIRAVAVERPKRIGSGSIHCLASSRLFPGLLVLEHPLRPGKAHELDGGQYLIRPTVDPRVIGGRGMVEENAPAVGGKTFSCPGQWAAPMSSPLPIGNASRRGTAAPS